MSEDGWPDEIVLVDEPVLRGCLATLVTAIAISGWFLTRRTGRGRRHRPGKRSEQPPRSSS